MIRSLDVYDEYKMTQIESSKNTRTCGNYGKENSKYDKNNKASNKTNTK